MPTPLPSRLRDLRRPALLAAVLVVCAGLTLFLMAQDYANFPPLPTGAPGWEYRNNVPGALSQHNLWVLAGVAAGLWMTWPFRKRVFAIVKLLLLLLFVALAVAAWSGAMHHGGVASIHALWSSFLVVWGAFAMPWRSLATR
jgi:hypothetical protein